MATPRNLAILVLAILVIAVVAFLVLRGAPGISPYGAPPPEETPEATPTATETPAAVGEVVEIVVEGTEFSFSPDRIEVEAGVTVRIIFRNVGNVPHALVIEGENFRQRTDVIGSGGEETIEFTAPSPGEYVIYCPVGNHRQLGMEGTFIVTEGSDTGSSESESVIEVPGY